MSALPRSFFGRDTLVVARELIGCTLVLDEPAGVTRGRIVEVEAYQGEDDPACHAAAGLTRRTEPLYGMPGIAYIYLIYGVHHCLNAVTRAPGEPSAVLIRAVEPVAGFDRMRARRAARRRSPSAIGDRDLANGPGKLCDAFGLTLTDNGLDLTKERLSIELGAAQGEVVWSRRVGINVGTDRFWRCFERESPYVSRSALNREVEAEPRPITIGSIETERAVS